MSSLEFSTLFKIADQILTTSSFILGKLLNDPKVINPFV
jgi:hypothetical protein